MRLAGIDSGGTSCRLVLCAEDGAVLSACRVPGHNPNADGFGPLEQSLRQGRRRPHRRDGHGGLFAAGNSPPALWRLGLDGGRGRLRLAHRPGWASRRYGRGGQRSAGDLPDPAL